jgi:hypothetical protein
MMLEFAVLVATCALISILISVLGIILDNDVVVRIFSSIGIILVILVLILFMLFGKGWT